MAGGQTSSYRVSYLKQDGYLEKATAGTSDDPNVLATTDTNLYDAFGRRIAIDTNSAGQTTDQVRAFAYDAEGEILQRRDGSATSGTFTAAGTYGTQHYAYVNGQQVAEVDEAGGIDVLSGVTGFSNTTQGTSSYVAQAGDTMQSIAQQIYGDGSLWYVVADANGFSSPGDAPSAGQTLKLPEVTTNSNTANTFKPYNPHEISGSTTPSLSQAPQPPPSNHGCNALASIIVIAVAAVVSFATYHALDGPIYSWAAGAVAGAAGSAASQVAGDALGTQHGFDWGQVLTGAVGGAIGGAVASKLAGANAFARGATEGAASYVGTYETEKLVGEPAHFSWAGLVADAVGSGAAAEIGPTAAERQAGMTNGTLAEKIEANVVQEVVTREVSVGLGDNHVQSWQQIGEDIFGNALGNAAIAGIEETNRQREIKELEAKLQAFAQSQQPAEPASSAASTVGDYSVVIGQQLNPGMDSDPALHGLDSLFGETSTSSLGVPDWLISSPSSPMYVYATGDVVVHDRPSEEPSFWNGDKPFTVQFLSSNSPGALTYPGAPSDFNPLTPFKTDFGYGVNNDAVNALIAKSPTLTAALNYLTQVQGYSLQMITNGGETIVPTDATYGVIDLPISDANSPAGIVSTLAHEVGHALWGDVTLPASDALAMSEQQFVDAQVNQELQGEGVATLSNIKISEQIWPSMLTKYSEVNGISFKGALDVFAQAYDAFSSGAESLGQAASAIGIFYAAGEKPGLDQSKTYDQYYRGAAGNLYIVDESKDFQQWHHQLMTGQRTDRSQYQAALQAYLRQNGGGQ